MPQDPEAKKPDDWDDREKIDDPEDTKPEDWEKPEHIPDPDAKKPDDWDDEMDGEWEPPMIDNPDYKGEWKPRQIDNPNYKGKWVHPEIDNPEYTADDSLYKYDDIGALGFDLWQVRRAFNIFSIAKFKRSRRPKHKWGQPRIEAWLSSRLPVFLWKNWLKNFHRMIPIDLSSYLSFTN